VLVVLDAQNAGSGAMGLDERCVVMCVLDAS
jgi:hypothetical protein